VSTLSAREGYRLWAPHYEAETAISYLEDQTVAGLDVRTIGRSLLDAGCGTARRLRESGAALGVGVDASCEMLRVARDEQDVAAGDVRALPFAAESFDVVWCRLMIGHLRDIAAAYAELARVCSRGGTVIVSDICPEAVEAGHRRTFRDSLGMVHEVEHYVHSVETHVEAARVAELELASWVDAVVGPPIEPFYARAGRIDLYEAQRGQAIVRVLSWRKRATLFAGPAS
jgi:malonyl-CoA O-methyltransferase